MASAIIKLTVMRKIFFLIFLSFIFSLVFVSSAWAGANHNVSGWAWSSNIGWISFNNTTGGGGINYGVHIDPLSKEFSGYAWSNNIGWISFNKADLAGCLDGNCLAKLDLDNGEVSGWARALSQGDNWDGWIKLRGVTSPPPYVYGVKVNLTNKELEGWAWGSDVIGWISFNCKNEDICSTKSNYKVIADINRPPTATNLSVPSCCYCETPVQQKFSWKFSDPDGDNQKYYWLQVDKQGDFLSFGEGEYDLKVGSYAANNTVTQGFTSLVKTPGNNQLGYNINYYWRLKVIDSREATSTWISGPSFTTPTHIFPSPNFSWKPENPSKDEVVQLCAVKEGDCLDMEEENDSVCYNSVNGEISCSNAGLNWILPSEAEFTGTSTASTKNPKVKFKTEATHIIKLEITDDVGGCSCEKSIGISKALPEWKEVAP